MKSFVSILLLVSTLLLCVSCASDSAKHYEIELNMDNYTTYLDFSEKANSWYAISGVLQFAYYENVEVTLQSQYIIYGESEYRTETKTLSLNAAGYVLFRASEVFSSDSPVSIVAISGKVMFSA